MDKEIIIDGVDVAGCFNLDEWKHCNICQELIKTIPNRHQCLIEEELRCEFYTNCYYKQLKRLEQDNEELKAENERLKEEILKWQKAYSRQYQINENKGYNKKEEQYRQTLQEIKEIAENCMNRDTCYDCKYCDDCYIEDAEIPTYDICKLLIQKITKAEEE